MVCKMKIDTLFLLKNKINKKFLKIHDFRVVAHPCDPDTGKAEAEDYKLKIIVCI